MKKYFRTGPKSDPAKYESHLYEIKEDIDINNPDRMLEIAEHFNYTIPKWIEVELRFNENFLRYRSITCEMKVYEYRKLKRGLSDFIDDKYPDVAGAKLAGENIELLFEAKAHLKKGEDYNALENLYRVASASRALVTANMEARFLSEQDRVSKIAPNKYNESDYQKASEVMINRGGNSKKWAYLKIEREISMSESTVKRAIKDGKIKINKN